MAAGIASRVASLDWCSLGRVGYRDARRLQEALVSRRAAGACDDLLLLLEHPPVVTVGRAVAARGGLPGLQGRHVESVDRGGGPTYHGPGQLVAYPVVSIPHAGRGVRRFVAALEASMVDVAARFGIRAGTRPGHPGAWLEGGPPHRKVGSIGIGVRRGVSLHGAALNVLRDAEAGFAGFAPCGIADAVAGSLAGELGGDRPTLDEVIPAWAETIAACLGRVAREVPTIGLVDVEDAAGRDESGVAADGGEVARWT